MLFLALYRVFKCMEPLSFDSPEETDKVRSSLIPTNDGWELNFRPPAQ